MLSTMSRVQPPRFVQSLMPHPKPLNDTLLVGPTVHPSLVDVLIHLP